MPDTIREIPWDEDPEDRNPDDWELEQPDNLRYYRNYYPQHAPSFFRRFLQKIETLELIPSGCEQFERQYYGSEWPEIVSSILAWRDSHSANILSTLFSAILLGKFFSRRMAGQTTFFKGTGSVIWKRYGRPSSAMLWIE